MKHALLLAAASLVFISCSPPRPPCDPSSCAGCCDSTGQCQLGFTQNACGQLGAGCDVCVGAQTCQLGRCSLPNGGGSGGGTGGGAGGGAGGGLGGTGGGGGTTTSFGPCGARGECTTGICDRPRNLCVTCRGPIDCDDGLVCTNGACVAGTGCTSDLDCTPQGNVCDVSGGRCVQCKGSAECATGQACIGFTCALVVSCMSSLDCTARKQICAPALPPRFPTTVTQACQDCASGNDCPAGSDCQSGVCIGAAADAGTDAGVCAACRYGEFCEVDAGVASCSSDYDAQLRPYCDACTVGGPNACGPGPNFCLVTGSEASCGVDCSSGQGCPLGYSCQDIALVLTAQSCSMANACPGNPSLPCATAADCRNGATCVRNFCTPPCLGNFCGCLVDADCIQETCSAGSCSISNRTCITEADCLPISCILSAGAGRCLVGRNCAPTPGLTCADVR